MKPYMKDEDLLKEYREAKDKRAQLKVLAELNACSVSDIREALKRAGADESELPPAMGRKKKPVPVQLAEEAAEEASMTFTPLTEEDVDELVSGESDPDEYAIRELAAAGKRETEYPPKKETVSREDARYAALIVRERMQFLEERRMQIAEEIDSMKAELVEIRAEERMIAAAAGYDEEF